MKPLLHRASQDAGSGIPKIGDGTGSEPQANNRDLAPVHSFLTRPPAHIPRCPVSDRGSATDRLAGWVGIL